jgi:SAM-dependent methyltransferase
MRTDLGSADRPLRLEIGPGSAGYDFNPKICPYHDNHIFVDLEAPPRDKPSSFLVGDAHHLPFRNESFREAYMSHVLEHLENPGAALLEARRVLVPGGRVFVWVPNFTDRTSVTNRSHRAVFNYFSLMHLLSRSGFQPASIPPQLPSRMFPGPLATALGIFMATELRVLARKN